MFPGTYPRVARLDSPSNPVPCLSLRALHSSTRVAKAGRLSDSCEQDFKDLEEQYSAKMAAEVQRYQELFQEKEGMNRRYAHPPTDHLWCSLTLG